MSKKIVVGIDIGTYQVKVVIAELTKNKNGKKVPRIIGKGLSESKGLRHGYIINTTDIVRSTQKAIEQAEESSGIKIRKAFISMGGISLEGLTAKGSTIISRADLEITDLDIKKALEDSEKSISITNKKIVHTIPLESKIDGKIVQGRPVGMEGSKLEIKTLFITCLKQHLEDLIQAVEEAGVEVEDVIASPIAASFVTLTKAQKIAGCVLVNLGAETVSIVVFENNIPISLEVFPVGSTNITNDIALNFKIPLDEAEKIKLGYISASQYPRKKLEEIVLNRLVDIFKLIDAHLKKIGRNELLPAGVILTGGGSGITTIEDLAKGMLKLPSRIASTYFSDNKSNTIKDSTWAVAYGLCISGLISGESSGIKIAKETKNKLLNWLKQFLV
ncbi:cell division protein FtsA [Patescibacteria group bacterium]